VEKQAGHTLRALPEVDERRQHQRVEPQGATVDVLQSGGTETFDIDNLSEGGALIAGRVVVDLSTTLELRIQLPGLAAFVLPARVLRHVPRAGKEYTAVMFLLSSDQLTQWISDIVLQGLRAAFPDL